ncbi:MAG: hypothetical protein PHV77_02585 [Candidatus Omnitrophica bacterium]|nr:hypothetical protein [Candidatus Omnitrophota bacterium]
MIDGLSEQFTALGAVKNNKGNYEAADIARAQLLKAKWGDLAAIKALTDPQGTLDAAIADYEEMIDGLSEQFTALGAVKNNKGNYEAADIARAQLLNGGWGDINAVKELLNPVATLNKEIEKYDAMMRELKPTLDRLRLRAGYARDISAYTDREIAIAQLVVYHKWDIDKAELLFDPLSKLQEEIAKQKQNQEIFMNTIKNELELIGAKLDEDTRNYKENDIACAALMHFFGYTETQAKALPDQMAKYNELVDKEAKQLEEALEKMGKVKGGNGEYDSSDIVRARFVMEGLMDPDEASALDIDKINYAMIKDKAVEKNKDVTKVLKTFGLSYDETKKVYYIEETTVNGSISTVAVTTYKPETLDRIEKSYHTTIDTTDTLGNPITVTIDKSGNVTSIGDKKPSESEETVIGNVKLGDQASPLTLYKNENGEYRLKVDTISGQDTISAALTGDGSFQLLANTKEFEIDGKKGELVGGIKFTVLNNGDIQLQSGFIRVDNTIKLILNGKIEEKRNIADGEQPTVAEATINAFYNIIETIQDDVIKSLNSDIREGDIFSKIFITYDSDKGEYKVQTDWDTLGLFVSQDIASLTDLITEHIMPQEELADLTVQCIQPAKTITDAKKAYEEKKRSLYEEWQETLTLHNNVETALTDLSGQGIDSYGAPYKVPKFIDVKSFVDKNVYDNYKTNYDNLNIEIGEYTVLYERLYYSQITNSSGVFLEDAWDSLKGASSTAQKDLDEAIDSKISSIRTSNLNNVEEAQTIIDGYLSTKQHSTDETQISNAYTSYLKGIGSGVENLKRALSRAGISVPEYTSGGVTVGIDESIDLTIINGWINNLITARGNLTDAETAAVKGAGGEKTRLEAELSKLTGALDTYYYNVDINTPDNWVLQSKYNGLEAEIELEKQNLPTTEITKTRINYSSYKSSLESSLGIEGLKTAWDAAVVAEAIALTALNTANDKVKTLEYEKGSLETQVTNAKTTVRSSAFATHLQDILTPLYTERRGLQAELQKLRTDKVSLLSDINSMSGIAGKNMESLESELKTKKDKRDEYNKLSNAYFAAGTNDSKKAYELTYVFPKEADFAKIKTRITMNEGYRDDPKNKAIKDTFQNNITTAQQDLVNLTHEKNRLQTQYGIDQAKIKQSNIKSAMEKILPNQAAYTALVSDIADLETKISSLNALSLKEKELQRVEEQIGIKDERVKQIDKDVKYYESESYRNEYYGSYSYSGNEKIAGLENDLRIKTGNLLTAEGEASTANSSWENAKAATGTAKAAYDTAVGKILSEAAYNANPQYKTITTQKNKMTETDEGKLKGYISQLETWKNMTFEDFKADYLKQDVSLNGLKTDFIRDNGMDPDAAKQRIFEITGHNYGSSLGPDEQYASGSELGSLYATIILNDATCKDIRKNIETLTTNITNASQVIFAKADAIRVKYDNPLTGYTTFKKEYGDPLGSGVMSSFLEENNFTSLEQANTRLVDLIGYTLDEVCSPQEKYITATKESKIGKVEAQIEVYNALKDVTKMPNNIGIIGDIPQNIATLRQNVVKAKEAFAPFDCEEGFKLFAKDFINKDTRIKDKVSTIKECIYNYSIAHDNVTNALTAYSNSFTAEETGKIVVAKKAHDDLTLDNYEPIYYREHGIERFRIVPASIAGGKAGMYPMALGVLLTNLALNDGGENVITGLYEIAINQGWIKQGGHLIDMDSDIVQGILNGTYDVPGLSEEGMGVIGKVTEAYRVSNQKQIDDLTREITRDTNELQALMQEEQLNTSHDISSNPYAVAEIQAIGAGIPKKTNELDQMIFNLNNRQFGFASDKSLNYGLRYEYVRPNGANATQLFDDVSWSFTLAGSLTSADAEIFSSLLGYGLPSAGTLYDGMPIVLTMGVNHSFINADKVVPYSSLTSEHKARVDTSIQDITHQTGLHPDNVNWTWYSNLGQNDNLSFTASSKTTSVTASVGYNGINSYTHIKNGALEGFMASGSDGWGKPIKFEYTWKNGHYVSSLESTPRGSNSVFGPEDYDTFYFDNSLIGYAQNKVNYWYGSEMITQTGYFNPSKLSYNAVDTFSPTALWVNRIGNSVRWVVDSLIVTFGNIFTLGSWAKSSELGNYASIDTLYRKNQGWGGWYGNVLDIGEIVVDILTWGYLGSLGAAKLAFISANVSSVVSTAGRFIKPLVTYLGTIPAAAYNMTVGLGFMTHTMSKAISLGLNLAGLDQDSVSRMGPGFLKDILNTTHYMGSGSPYSSILNHVGTPEGLAFIGFFSLLGPVMNMGGAWMQSKIITPLKSSFNTWTGKAVQFVKSHAQSLTSITAINALMGSATNPFLTLFSFGIKSAGSFFLKYSYEGMKFIGKNILKFGSFVTGSAADSFKSKFFAFISRGLGGVCEEALVEPLLQTMFLSGLPDNTQEFVVEFLSMDGNTSYNMNPSAYINALSGVDQVLGVITQFAGISGADRNSIMKALGKEFGKMKLGQNLTRVLHATGVLLDNYKEVFGNATDAQRIQLAGLLAQTNYFLNNLQRIDSQSEAFKLNFSEIYGNNSFMQYAADMYTINTQAKMSMKLLNSRSLFSTAQTVNHGHLLNLNAIGVSADGLNGVINNPVFKNEGLKTVFNNIIPDLGTFQKEIQLTGNAINLTAENINTALNYFRGHSVTANTSEYNQSMMTLVRALNVPKSMNEQTQTDARSLLKVEFSKLANDGQFLPSLTNLFLMDEVYKVLSDNSLDSEFHQYLKQIAINAMTTPDISNGYNLDIIARVLIESDNFFDAKFRSNLVNYIDKTINKIDIGQLGDAGSVSVLNGLQYVINTVDDNAILKHAVSKVTGIAQAVISNVQITDSEKITALSQTLSVLHDVEISKIGLDNKQIGFITQVKVNAAEKIYNIITNISADNLSETDVTAVISGLYSIKDMMPLKSQYTDFNEMIFEKTLSLYKRLNEFVYDPANNNPDTFDTLMDATMRASSLLSSAMLGLSLNPNYNKKTIDDSKILIRDTYAKWAEIITESNLLVRVKQAALTNMLESATQISWNMGQEGWLEFVPSVMSAFAQSFGAVFDSSSIDNTVSGFVSLFNNADFTVDYKAVFAAVNLINRMIDFKVSDSIDSIKNAMPNIAKAVKSLYNSEYKGKLDPIGASERILFKDIILNLEAIVAVSGQSGKLENLGLDTVKAELALSIINDIRLSTRADQALADNIVAVVKLVPALSEKVLSAFLNNGVAVPNVSKLAWLAGHLSLSDMQVWRAIAGTIKAASKTNTPFSMLKTAVDGDYEKLQEMKDNLQMYAQLGADKKSAVARFLKASPFSITSKDEEEIKAKRDLLVKWLEDNYKEIRDISKKIDALVKDGIIKDGIIDDNIIKDIERKINNFKKIHGFAAEADRMSKGFEVLKKCLEDNKGHGIDYLNRVLKASEDGVNKIDELLKNTADPAEQAKLSNGRLELINKIGVYQENKDKLEGLQLALKPTVASIAKSGLIRLDSMGRAIDSKDALALSLAVSQFLAIEDPAKKWPAQQEFIFGLWEGKFSSLGMSGGKTLAFAVEMAAKSLVLGNDFRAMFILESEEAIKKYLSKSAQGLNESPLGVLNAFGLKLKSGDEYMEKMKSLDVGTHDDALNKFISDLKDPHVIIAMSRTARGHLQTMLSSMGYEGLRSAVEATNLLRIDEFDSVIKIRETYNVSEQSDDKVSEERVNKIKALLNIITTALSKAGYTTKDGKEIKIAELTKLDDFRKHNGDHDMYMYYNKDTGKIFLNIAALAALTELGYKESEIQSVILAIKHVKDENYFIDAKNQKIGPVSTGTASPGSVFQDINYVIALAWKEGEGKLVDPKGLTVSRTSMQSTLREIFRMHRDADMAGGSGTYTEIVAILGPLTGLEFDYERMDNPKFEKLGFQFVKELSEVKDMISNAIMDFDAKEIVGMPKVLHLLSLYQTDKELFEYMSAGILESLVSRGAVLNYAPQAQMEGLIKTVKEKLINRLKDHKDDYAKKLKVKFTQLQEAAIKNHESKELIKLLEDCITWFDDIDKNADKIAEYIMGSEYSILAMTENTNEIADKAHLGHIVFTNQAGIVGLNYVKDIDIHIVADYLGEDLLKQALHRVFRNPFTDQAVRVVYMNEGIVKERLAYAAKHIDIISNILGCDKYDTQAQILLEVFKAGKFDNFDKLKGEAMLEAAQFAFKVKSAMEVSATNYFIIADIAQGYLKEGLKDLLLTYKPGTKEGDIIDKEFRKLLEIDPADALVNLRYSPEADAGEILKNIFTKNSEIARQVLQNIIQELEKVKTDTAQNAINDLKVKLDEYNQDIYTSEQGPMSLIDAQSWKDIYLTSRRLVDYMLADTAGAVYSKILIEAGKINQHGQDALAKIPNAPQTDDLQSGTLTVDAAKTLLSSEGENDEPGMPQSEVDEFIKFLTANNMISNDRLTPSGMILFNIANTIKNRFFGLKPEDPDRQALAGLLLDDSKKQGAGILDIVLAIANRAGMISRLTGFDLENLILIAREVSAIQSVFTDFKLEISDLAVIVTCTHGASALLISSDDPEYRLNHARDAIKNRLIELNQKGIIKHDFFNNITAGRDKLLSAIDSLNFSDEVKIALECVFLPDIGKAMDEIRSQAVAGYKPGIKDLEKAARLMVDFYSQKDNINDAGAYDSMGMADKAEEYIKAWAKAVGKITLTPTEIEVLVAIVKKLFLAETGAAPLSYTDVHELAEDVYSKEGPALSTRPIPIPNSELDLYSDFTKSAGNGIKLTIDENDKFVVVKDGSEKDVELIELIMAGTEDAVNILKELIKDNPDLQKLFDAIMHAAKYGSGYRDDNNQGGIVIRRVNRNDIGSIADKDVNLRVTFEEEGNSLATIELSDQWVRTMSGMMSLDTSKGKRAASYLIFETLIHELSHTDDISKPFQQIAEELRNYTAIDYNLEKILYSLEEKEIADLKQEVSGLIRNASLMTGKTGLAGHIRDFTDKDDATGKRSLITDWKRVVEKITNSMAQRSSNNNTRPLPYDIEIIEGNESLRADIADAIAKEMAEETPDFVGLKDKIYNLIAKFALESRAAELNNNKNILQAMNINIDGLIAKTKGNLTPDEVAQLANEIAGIEKMLDSELLASLTNKAASAAIPTAKQASAGIVSAQDALAGFDPLIASRIAGIIKDNNVDLVLSSNKPHDGFAGLGITELGERIQMPVLLIEALGLFGSNGAAILSSILAGIAAARAGSDPFGAQADYLGVTIKQVKKLYEDLGIIMGNLDLVKQRIIDPSERQELVAALSKTIDINKRKGETIEALERDLSDIEGLPQGIRNGFVNPIFDIMVIKPRMSQFEVKGELTQDMVLAISKLVIAAIEKPQYMNIATGNAYVFEANTVTESLAITLGAIVNNLPQEEQDMLNISVYGNNSHDAIKLLGAYGVKAKGVAGLEPVNAATIVYSDAGEMVDIRAEHIRYVEVEKGFETADNMVTAVQVIFAVFQMPFRQFAENLRNAGIDIGISDEEMRYMFANADSLEGVVKIKPVDRETIERIGNMIKQAV